MNNHPSPKVPSLQALAAILLILLPLLSSAQDTVRPMDSSQLEARIRHFHAIHGIGTGLCVVGGVTTAVGLILFIPAITSTGATETQSNTPYRATTLAILAGGLTIGIVGIVTLSHANAKLTVLRKQQQDLSVGYEVSQGYPGISVRYRF
jgi:hypothetical protein